MFVADFQSQADLLVYKVHYASQLGKNDGNWFYVKYKSQADKTIYYCEYASQADIKIYFVKYKSQSKWVKDKNKHLFY